MRLQNGFRIAIKPVKKTALIALTRTLRFNFDVLGKGTEETVMLERNETDSNGSSRIEGDGNASAYEVDYEVDLAGESPASVDASAHYSNTSDVFFVARSKQRRSAASWRKL